MRKVILHDLILEYLTKIKTFLWKHKVTFAYFYAIALTVVLVFSFFYRPVVVSGSSMLPTLSSEETVLIKKNIDERDIKRGDIIVFYSPFDKNKLLIKRVIAVGGDTVAILDGNVYVNGSLIKEPYVNSVRSHETIPLLRVPEGCFYVLGDNRVVSSDSREFGCVRFGSIYGKLIFAGEKEFNK